MTKQNLKSILNNKKSVLIGALFLFVFVCIFLTIVYFYKNKEPEFQIPKVEYEWEKTETGECEIIEEVPIGAKIVAINGTPVEWFCESCEVPIHPSDHYSCDVEGVMLCEKCTKEMLKEI